MKPDYAVFVEGTDEVAAKYASILAITLSSIKQYYDEKYDRNNFIKNVVLDNVLPGDVHVKARELHFSADISRVVLLIRILSTNDVSAYDVIQNLFPDFPGLHEEALKTKSICEKTQPEQMAVDS